MQYRRMKLNLYPSAKAGDKKAIFFLFSKGCQNRALKCIHSFSTGPSHHERPHLQVTNGYLTKKLKMLNFSLVI